MATAAEKELAEIRESGLEVVEILQSYRNRRRILCFDKGAVMPWVICGCGCGWYFETEQAARDWHAEETARAHRRAAHGRREEDPE